MMRTSTWFFSESKALTQLFRKRQRAFQEVRSCPFSAIILQRKPLIEKGEKSTNPVTGPADNFQVKLRGKDLEKWIKQTKGRAKKLPDLLVKCPTDYFNNQTLCGWMQILPW